MEALMGRILRFLYDSFLTLSDDHEIQQRGRYIVYLIAVKQTFRKIGRTVSDYKKFRITFLLETTCLTIL